MKVLIVGAGVAGLAVGWRLASAGIPVEILERGLAGRGATWASAGMIASGAELGTEKNAVAHFAHEARAKWPRFAQDLEAASGRRIDYRETGSLMAATNADKARDLEHRAAELAREGVAAAWVDAAELRRACEIQTRGHLLHLREGYLETRGRADALSDLIVQSAPAFAALLTSVARLEGHVGGDVGAAARHAERTLSVSGGAITDIVKLVGIHELPSADAERLFVPYLDALERLVDYVDGWSAR